MSAPTATSRWLRVETAGLPAELTQGVRYVVWKAEPRSGKPGKWEKAPRRSDTLGLASTTDPSTWSSFSDAFTAYEQHPELTGIGRIMSDGDDITGIDLDDSIGEDGTSITSWAQEIVDALPGAYWERSPSGTGLRGFCRGKLPPGRRKRTYQGASIEIYDDVRHLTLTGHARTFVDTLPQLQEAVEAVHARWFAGGDAADGAIATTRTGPADTVSPEGLTVLELVMGGKYAAQMTDIWAGTTNSDQDWALACETARAAILLGHTGDALGQVVEDVLRAGPWRPKWDRPYTVTEHGQTVHTTWLGRTIGRAINTVRARISRAPDFRVDELDDDQELPPAEETIEQQVTRLKRENAQLRAVNAQLRAVNAQQMTVIRAERTERAALTDTLRGITAVLALPKEQASPAFKVLSVVATLEMHSRASRGITTLPAVVLQERSGFTTSLVSTVMQDLAARDGSPIERKLTREWRKDELGQDQPITVCETIPVHQTVPESLAALCTMGGPSSREQQRRQKDRERTERNQTWGQCSTHDNHLVAVKGFCPTCGELVGERIVTVQEFEILNPGFRDSGLDAPLPVVVVTTCDEIRDSDTNGLETGIRFPAMPPLFPPEMAGTDAVCDTHGIPKLKSGRCSMCTTPPQPPIMPAPSSERCIRMRCRAPCGPGDKLLCVEHRAEASQDVVSFADDSPALEGPPAWPEPWPDVELPVVSGGAE